MRGEQVTEIGWMGCERDCLQKKRADRIEMTGMFCYKKWSAAQHSTVQHNTTQLSTTL
jgi:hypothetical protein